MLSSLTIAISIVTVAHSNMKELCNNSRVIVETRRR